MNHFNLKYFKIHKVVTLIDLFTLKVYIYLLKADKQRKTVSKISMFNYFY